MLLFITVYLFIPFWLFGRFCRMLTTRGAHRGKRLLTTTVVQCGSGWVGSSVSCYFWVGSGWVTSLVGRVGSGQENLTHVQLCHTCIRWSFHYHSIRLAAERYTTIIELARVRHPARYICFLYNAITGRLLLPAIPMLTRRLIELGFVICWRTIRQTQ